MIQHNKKIELWPPVKEERILQEFNKQADTFMVIFTGRDFAGFCHLRSAEPGKLLKIETSTFITLPHANTVSAIYSRFQAVQA